METVESLGAKSSREVKVGNITTHVSVTNRITHIRQDSCLGFFSDDWFGSLSEYQLIIFKLGVEKYT